MKPRFSSWSSKFNLLRPQGAEIGVFLLVISRACFQLTTNKKPLTAAAGGASILARGIASPPPLTLVCDILSFASGSPTYTNFEVSGLIACLKQRINSTFSMSSSPYSEENESSPSESVTLTDAAGRSLNCYIEHSVEVEGSEYLLLLPMDSPVEIVAWSEDGEEEAILLEDDAEIDKVFADAQAVLSELNLALKRTAYALTVAGELPPVEEQDILTLEVEEEGSDLEAEEFQFLASFYHEEQEYAVYTPLDPLLFFARQNDSGKPELLSPEEFKKVQPLLEEMLFDELE